jgi:hypothetical protein
VPRARATRIYDFNGTRTRPVTVRADDRPVLARPINRLNPHRKVKPIKHVISWAGTGRFAWWARPFRPVVGDRGWGDGRGRQVMKNASQWVRSGNGLRRHTAEDDLLPAVVCDPGRQDRERPPLVLTRRSERAELDDERNRSWLDGSNSAAFANVTASFSSLAPARIVCWPDVSTEGMSSRNRASNKSARVRRHGREAPIFAPRSR